MSIFGSILTKIFGQSPAAAQEAAQAPSAAAPSAAPSMPPPGAPLPTGDVAPTPAPGGTAASAAAAAPPQQVDVNAVLTEMAAKNGQKLNWKQSIVDLMKLLGLDSSLEARKELARELNYSGDTNDSATMNIWLHKQVMAKLAENGGIVPPELRS